MLLWTRKHQCCPPAKTSISSVKTLGVVWLGLVSLFNCISTFVGYLMPKQWYYLTYSWGDKGFMPFLRVLVQPDCCSNSPTSKPQSSTLAITLRWHPVGAVETTYQMRWLVGMDGSRETDSPKNSCSKHALMIQFEANTCYQSFTYV